MKYIITESKFNDVVKNLRKGEELEENERQIKKLIDKFISQHLFDGLTEGEPLRREGYVRTWYIGSHPVIGLSWGNELFFNIDMVISLESTFELDMPQAKLMLRKWMENNMI